MQEAIWHAEMAPLQAIALSILKSRTDAEQIISDLFTDFFFHYVDRVRESRSIPAYLRIMARRRCVRSRERIAKLVPLEQENQASNPTKEAEGRVDDGRRLRWLEICLGRLRPRIRKILKLHYGHNSSYSEIGSHLDISRQAVGKTVKKARTALKTCIEKHTVADSKARLQNDS